MGQIAGPLSAGAIAQASDLRAGMLVLPALTIVAAAALHCATAAQQNGARSAVG
jgi:hypothetical protein